MRLKILLSQIQSISTYRMAYDLKKLCAVSHKIKVYFCTVQLKLFMKFIEYILQLNFEIGIEYVINIEQNDMYIQDLRDFIFVLGIC